MNEEGLVFKSYQIYKVFRKVMPNGNLKNYVVVDVCTTTATSFFCNSHKARIVGEIYVQVVSVSL